MVSIDLTSDGQSLQKTSADDWKQDATFDNLDNDIFEDEIESASGKENLFSKYVVLRLKKLKKMI